MKNLIIRQLINLLIVMAFFNYTNRSISNYGLGIYRYYKLLGMKEINIIVRYIKNNCFRYLLCFCLFFASVYAGEVLPALCCTVQFIMYCNCLVLALYVLMHKPKYKTIIFLGFTMLCIICVMDSLYQVFRLTGNHVDLMEMVVLLANSTPMSLYRAIFFECNPYIIAVVMILTALLIKKTGSLDDVSVIEAFSKNKKSLTKVWLNKLIGQKGYGLFRDMIITFRNKETLFSYALTFGLYVFCCCLFGHVWQLLAGVSVFCIVLINYGLECVYLNDTATLNIYKLFGEDYHGFLQTKMRISGIINLIFCSVYTIKCIEINCMKEWFILLLIHIISIGYWNLYYSYLYIGMKRYGTLPDIIKRFIAFIIGMIPGLNILFAIMYYKKGRRRWNCYVNNGQGDKEI